MRRLIPLLAVMLVAGCGGGGDTTTTAAPSTTEAAPTTTAAAATTTTTVPTPTTAEPTTTAAAGGPYAVEEPNVAPVEPLPGSEGASGSGCTPGTDALPDGIWFGYVTARSASAIDFDLACWYFGDIAYTEGAEDGEEVNNDYYVRNVNPTLRTITVDGSVPVYEINAGDISFNAVPFADWPLDPEGYIACPSDWCGVWLYVNDGNVTEIQEQYIP